ncbi:MAG: hypothetical protein PUP92_12385 [Rhizonema sp. PD38]|nr:hypothetical protein [Rhizonema sp. PD38]
MQTSANTLIQLSFILIYSLRIGYSKDLFFVIYYYSPMFESGQNRTIIGLLVDTLSGYSKWVIPTPDFLTYNNPNLGIKMKYPENWERLDINNPITGEVVAFLSPKQSDTDNFQEKVTITVEDFSGTLNEYSDLSIQEIHKVE